MSDTLTTEQIAELRRLHDAYRFGEFELGRDGASARYAARQNMIDALMPKLAALLAAAEENVVLKERIAEVEKERDDYRHRKDNAYEERNKVVAALASMFPSGVKDTDIPGWDSEWHGCVYIDLPTGQVSWHFHDSQRYLFEHFPPYDKAWDGHDTPEKYRRLARLGEAKLAALIGNDNG